jgi:hypothetical protein
MPPLARIVTRNPEAVEPIAAHLRALGYVVEIVSPDQIPADAAAVDVRVDETTVDQAVTYAQSFVQSGGDVFVDARALLQPEPLPEPAIETIEAESESRLSEIAANAVRHTQAMLRAELTRLYEERQIRLAEQARRRQERAEQLRIYKLERARLAQQEREYQQQAQLERERLARLESERRQAQLGAERARIAELEAARQQAERATRLEEERRRQAQIAEQQRAAVPPQVPAVGSLPSQVAPQTPQAAGPTPVSPQRSSLPPRPRPVSRMRRFRASRSLREWGSAATAAAITIVVLLMAWSAISHPRPASPLSNRDLMQMRQVQEQVPFGAVILKPAAPPPTHTNRAATPAAAKRTTKAERKPSPVRTRRISHVYDDAVIIRHFAPQPAVHKRQDTASVKHFSDMD